MLSSYVTHDTAEELPVDDISDAAHANDAYSIVDAAQAAFHIPFTHDEVGADLIVGSLHK